jgi:hypothetical protein
VPQRNVDGKMQLPVFVGFSEHIMGLAHIKIDGDDVTITIKSEGQEGLTLATFLTGGEPVALSFSAIPVQPRSPHQ